MTSARGDRLPRAGLAAATTDDSGPRLLGLFAKRPEPGQVKTRLAAATSPDWAARVALAFLQDTIERAAALDIRRVLAFTPRDAADWFAQLGQDRFDLVPQADGDLGQRMASFCRQSLTEHGGRVVLIGSDSPTLPAELIERAFAELRRVDVVLGPATDGGYYLVGAARQLPPIFEQVAWGTPHVLRQTIARLADPSWSLAVLPPWYDVDTLDDWEFLVAHLAALRRAGMDPHAPRTEALAASWSKDRPS